MAYVSTQSYGGDPIMLLLGNSRFTGGMTGMGDLGDLGDVIAGVSGLGDVSGYSGLINTPSGTANVNLTTHDLAAAQAMIWGLPISQVDTPTWPSSGYIQNVLQYIQAGALVFNPGTRGWSMSKNPVPPSAAAAAAATAANAASPFATPVKSPAYTGSPVYSQPQNPAAVLASQPQVNISPLPARNAQLSFVSSSGGNALSVGDTWTVTITGAPPNTPVSVTGNTSGSLNDSVTTPMGSTDGNGAFSLTGRIGPDQVGVWAETWNVGGQAVGSFAFTASATPASNPPSQPSAPVQPSSSSGGCDPGINPAACGPSPGSYFQQTVSIGGLQIPVWGFIVAAGGAALLLLGEKS